MSESDVHGGTSWTREVASYTVPGIGVGALQALEKVGAEGEKEDRVVSDPALS